MDTLIGQERFDTKLNAQDAPKSWRHWLTNLNELIVSATVIQMQCGKLSVLKS